MIENISIIRGTGKNVRIVIKSNTDIEVHAPRKMPLDSITKIVKEKENWILKKITYIKHNLNKNKHILNYEDVLFLGNTYEILLSNVKSVEIEEEIIKIPEDKAEKKIEILKKWYRKKANIILLNRLEELAESLRIKIKKISLCDSKAKWGSCDSEKKIKLNWRLVMLSPDEIDFVLFHELMHTYEMNHSKNFFYLLNQVCPNWKNLRSNLKSKNFLLKLFRI